MSPAPITSARPDWDVPEPVRAGVGPGLVGPLVAAVLIGVLVWALISIWVGLAVAAVLAVGWILWAFTRGRAALRAIGAEPLEPESEPRLENLVAGAASDLGTEIPRLWVIPHDRINALVAWSRGGDLAVTEGALRNLPRTELEAVVAHCMVRIASGEARRATFALALGDFGRSLVRVGLALDVRAAALTRYPPALAAALRRCEPIDGFRPLWLVADGPTHAGREDRAEALLDL